MAAKKTGEPEEVKKTTKAASKKAEAAKQASDAAAEDRLPAPKIIGVLTSGGDAPGMNAAVRAVVRTAVAKGIKVIGIQRGFSGLIEREYLELTSRSVAGTIQKGGTFLLSARCPEMMTREGQDLAAKVCKEIGIEALVIIGGDGSFKGGLSLYKRGINIIGIPGTIDLDISCTDYTIGFDTAVNTAMDAIDKIRDTSTSHERCSIIEVMGRSAGHIALWCGIATGAEAVLSNELYHYEEQNLINDIIKKRLNGRKHYVIVNAESIGDSEGMAKRIEYATGVETRATVLGYLQRGGSPSCKDRVFGSAMGAMAVDLLENGAKNRVIAYKNGTFTDFDIEEALKMKKTLDPHLVKMLDKLTRKGDQAMMSTEGMFPIESIVRKDMTVGIITSGDDSPGMNAVIRAAVRTAMYYGMRVIGFHRGFAGLIEQDFEEMNNRSLSETVQKGGTMLLSASCPEFMTKRGLERAARTLQEQHVDALIVVGGNGSMAGARDLMEKGINVIGIPATIDNDIAASEYSVGFDTAINTAMTAIDKVRDTSLSHERCSIIEVSGKTSGHNALWCGIASGAEEALTPEYYDHDESRIISRILKAKNSGKKLHLIVNADSVGGSNGLAKRIEFATGLETRATILGYIQGGGEPTCLDRVMGSAMGAKAVEAIYSGEKNRIIVYKNSEFVDVDLAEAIKIKAMPDKYLYSISKRLAR